jgi:nitric oxide synthase-interacting protein
MQCAHCDTKLLAEKKKPLIALKREGTGFAAGGLAEAKRFNLAFQA